MSFQDFLNYIGIPSKITFWGLLLFLMSIGIEIIPKFKFNPWSTFIGWLGGHFNAHLDVKISGKVEELKQKLTHTDKDLSEKVGSIDKKVDELSLELKRHIAESETKTLQDMRRDILDFCNSCMNGRRHTKEEFDFVINECDSYEKYIVAKKLKNGVIEAAIAEIRRLYTKCIQEHSFLKEGEDPNPSKKTN